MSLSGIPFAISTTDTDNLLYWTIQADQSIALEPKAENFKNQLWILNANSLIVSLGYPQLSVNNFYYVTNVNGQIAVQAFQPGSNQSFQINGSLFNSTISLGTGTQISYVEASGVLAPGATLKLLSDPNVNHWCINRLVF
nr:9663_t:CDS:2 [Entrophospora candida]